MQHDADFGSGSVFVFDATQFNHCVLGVYFHINRQPEEPTNIEISVFGGREFHCVLKMTVYVVRVDCR